MEPRFLVRKYRILLLLFLATVAGMALSCGWIPPGTSAPTEQRESDGIDIEPDLVDKTLEAQTTGQENDPNWPLLQAVLDEAISKIENQLDDVTWGKSQRVLISLGYDDETLVSHPEAIEYIRDRLQRYLTDVPSITLATEVKDNLGDRNAEELWKLGRTTNVDIFLFVESIRVGYYSTEQQIPSDAMFQGRAYVYMHPLIFGVEEGYYLWSGDLVYETLDGTFVLQVPTESADDRSLETDIFPTVKDPVLLLESPGVRQREIAWSPDGQSLLFWSGEVKEINDYPQLSGNLWISDLDGHATQITRLSPEASPITYNFVPNGDWIILTAADNYIHLVDRTGETLPPVPTSPFSMGSYIPIPGHNNLIAGYGGTGSSADHPDGLWIIDIESKTLHPFCDLFNNGRPLVDSIKDTFHLGSGSIHLDSNFGFSSDGEAMIFIALELPQDTDHFWHRTFLRFNMKTREVTLIGSIDVSSTVGQAFSPWADRAVISSYEDDGCILYLVGVQEGPHKINKTGCAYNPVWSPDGLWIVYAYREPNASANLWLTSAFGGESTMVANLDAKSIGRMAWSPDGQHLAIPATINGSDGIWILPIKHDKR